MHEKGDARVEAITRYALRVTDLLRPAADVLQMADAEIHQIVGGNADQVMGQLRASASDSMAVLLDACRNLRAVEPPAEAADQHAALVEAIGATARKWGVLLSAADARSIPLTRQAAGEIHAVAAALNRVREDLVGFLRALVAGTSRPAADAAPAGVRMPDELGDLAATFLHHLQRSDDEACWAMISARSRGLATVMTPEGDDPGCFLCDEMRKEWRPALITTAGIAPTRYVDEDHAWVPVIIEARGEVDVVTTPTLMPVVPVWFIREPDGWKVDPCRQPPEEASE